MPSFFAALAALLCAFTVASAADIEQVWNISYRLVYPDGVEKNVPVVNGMYPGPEIYGKVGDTVRIVVNNLMPTDTTTIHWHGVRQFGTPWMDGVPFVSQCPIGPGQTYIYQFFLDAPGTLWWHSHSGLQKSSLDGAIIIEGDEDEMPPYKEDKVMILTDWYHAQGSYQIQGLLAPNLRWVGNPQSMLLNGKGTFDCAETTLTCNASHPDAGPFYLDVDYDTTYRLRIVGSGTLAFFNLGIEGHPMELIEVETHALRPQKVNYLDVGSGMTYSALIRTKSKAQVMKERRNNGMYWIQLGMRMRETDPGQESLPRGLHVLRYPDNSGESVPKRRVPTPPAVFDFDWSIHQAQRMRSKKPSGTPLKADRRFTLVGTAGFLNITDTIDGQIMNNYAIAINNYSFLTPSTPVLHAVKFGLESETSKYVEQLTIPNEFDYLKQPAESGISMQTEAKTQVMKVKKDEVVDFVFQNVLWPGLGAEVHPWHLHLHDFWVLGYGDKGTTWNETAEKDYKLWKAPYRNTVGLYPTSWTAIRVRFNNPGAAIFHCHILPHLVLGMGFVVQIGEAEDMAPPPPNLPLCGADATKFSPPGQNPF